VDTSGFYALLVQADDRHGAATRQLLQARRRKRQFVTSDYILDETATLLKARGQAHLLSAFFTKVLTSKVCLVEWMDAERFLDVQVFFLKHADQAWSFTDCFSFRIMRELRLRDALTKDRHYDEAGFAALRA
jgi:predicted nucleic acid-binding protein